MCDLRPSALEKLGRRFPAVRQTQDFDEMLADPDLDAVAVVTPVATHYDLAMRALTRRQARVRREAARRLVG